MKEGYTSNKDQEFSKISDLILKVACNNNS